MERKESFYVKIKVIAFVIFELDSLKKKMMKKSAVSQGKWFMNTDFHGLSLHSAHTVRTLQKSA